MKQILILFIATVLTTSLVCAQAGWVDHKGDNRVSFKFPAEPQETQPGVFIAKDKDSTSYSFTIVDFMQVAGIDSATVASMKDAPEFVQQLKVGINQSLPDVKLSDVKKDDFKGHTSYNITGEDPQKQLYDLFMVLIGDKMYCFSTVRHGGVNTQGRDTFRNSIVLGN